MYERQMENTREYLLRYIATNNVNELESAWKILSELELDSVSPKLLNIKNLSIAVPGTYTPEKKNECVRGSAVA